MIYISAIQAIALPVTDGLSIPHYFYDKRSKVLYSINTSAKAKVYNKQLEILKNSS
jgi:phage regulator Rha-like protein